MDVKELKKIVELHAKWLVGDSAGIRANLRGANLDKLGLMYAILTGADVEKVNLVLGEIFLIGRM